MLLDPKTQAFLDALAQQGGPPVAELAVAEARRQQSEMQAVAVPTLPADVEDRTLPVGPTGGVAIRIVRLPASPDLLPAVIYLHGGGWVVGGKDTHDRLVRAIANGTGAAVVFVDYARSPEARY